MAWQSSTASRAAEQRRQRDSGEDAAMEDRRSCLWFHGVCETGGGEGERERERTKGEEGQPSVPKSQVRRKDGKPPGHGPTCFFAQQCRRHGMEHVPGSSTHAARVSLVCAPRGKDRQAGRQAGERGKCGEWKGGAAWRVHDDTSGWECSKRGGRDLHAPSGQCVRAQPWNPESWGWPTPTHFSLSHRYLPLQQRRRRPGSGRRPWAEIPRGPVGFGRRCVEVCWGLQGSDGDARVHGCGCLCRRAKDISKKYDKRRDQKKKKQARLVCLPAPSLRGGGQARAKREAGRVLRRCQLPDQTTMPSRAAGRAENKRRKKLVRPGTTQTGPARQHTNQASQGKERQRTLRLFSPRLVPRPSSPSFPPPC